MYKKFDKLFSINNKKIVVIGASRGIGKKITESFVFSKAKVIGISRSNPNIKSKNFYFSKCDISDEDEIKKTFLIIKKKLKKVDCVVNCAGITLTKNNKQNNFKQFKKILDLNLVSIFNFNLILIPILNKKSSIINISSIASYFGFKNNPGYISSKSALSGLTKSMAYDLANKKIRVNNLVLGYIYSNMTKKSYHSKKEYLIRKNRTLLKRWGKVEDIVGAAIFLASDSSSYITGSDIVIDGGWSAKGM